MKLLAALLVGLVLGAVLMGDGDQPLPEVRDPKFRR